MKVLVADDHRVVRDGLVAILEDEPGIEVLAALDDHPSVIRRMQQEPRPDVAVIDADMPGGSVLNTVSQLQVVGLARRVLILSMHPEDQLAVRILRAGAGGYMTKEHASDELIAALRRVASGERQVSPALTDRMLDMLDTGDRPRHERLSDREFQVFQALVAGQRVTAIADALHLSTKTVSTYRTRLLEKMDVRSTAELVRYAMQHGLFDGE